MESVPASTLSHSVRAMARADFRARIVRIVLGCLLAFLAINAWAGGIYGMSGAPGVSVSFLEGSPFRSYFIPGLFLFFVLGGALSLTAVAVFRRHRLARLASMIVAALLLCWIAVQVGIMGFQSWMQPSTAAAAILIMALAAALPPEKVRVQRWRVGSRRRGTAR